MNKNILGGVVLAGFLALLTFSYYIYELSVATSRYELCMTLDYSEASTVTCTFHADGGN